MDFRILGPLEVHDGDRKIPLAAGKQQALLALLILNANETVSTERLVEELWGEGAPATAPKVVQNHISQLRRALTRGKGGRGNGLLITQGSGYTLQLDRQRIDLGRFEKLLEQGRRALAYGDAQEASELLREALSLWRGPPLADFAFESFAQAEIGRLEELRLSALEQQIEADLALGRHAEVVPELERLIAAEPLRERLRGQLILALYRSGRQADALEAYRAARRALLDELGLEPGRALQELEGAILRQEAALDFKPPPEAPPPRAQHPSTLRSTGILVGREQELAEGVRALEDAFAGTGRLLLVSGDPGIGKSRLVEALAEQAARLNAEVLIGRCWEAGGAPPFWPWAQALRSYASRCDAQALRAQLGAGAAQVASVVPDLRTTLPELPEPAPSESEGARFRLFEAVAAFLERASNARPLLISLDDLHAADTPSLLLLRFVAGELERMRVLVVGVYRDVDPTLSSELAAAVADLSRREATKRIALGGLSKDEARRLVELNGGAPERLLAALYDETEGNPLFIGEMVRLLAAEGRPEDARLPIAIPDSVREVIGRRLRHLSDECRRVLTLASILGREFGLVALARVSDYAALDKLLEVLDEAIAARVVAEVPGSVGQLRFGHALIRDTLYTDLPATHRVRLHHRVAGVLEELYGADPEPHLAELAHHYVAAVPAVDAAPAAGYARRAGDRALGLLAYEEAARLYETALGALDLMDPPDEQTRCALLLSRGQAEARAGNTPAAEEAFLAAAAIARRLGLPRELGRAAAGYGGGHMWGRAGADPRLVPLLEEALAGLGEEEVELRTRLLARLAGALRDEHSRKRRDRVSKEALDLARRSGDPAALVYALDGRSAAIIAPDTVEECLALANELRDVAERSGDPDRFVHALDHRRTVLVMVGDLRSAEVDLAEEAVVAEELRQPAELWQVHAARAMLALAKGSLDEAEHLIPEAFTFGERSLPDTAIPVHRLQVYGLADFQDRLDDVVPLVREVAEAYPARVAFRCALAHVHARLGEKRGAELLLAELTADGFSTLPFDQEWLWAMSLLAETAALLDDVDSAALLYPLLAPWAGLNAADHPEGIRGSISRYLGLLAVMTDGKEQAGRHFEDALARNAEMGARPWLAHTQHDYGRLLLEHGERGRAIELLESSRTLSAELGLSALAGRISALA